MLECETLRLSFLFLLTLLMMGCSSVWKEQLTTERVVWHWSASISGEMDALKRLRALDCPKDFVLSPFDAYCIYRIQTGMQPAMQPVRLRITETNYLLFGDGISGDARLWIDGVSGRVSYDGRTWHAVGYLTTSSDGVVRLVQKGMPVADVEKLLGVTVVKRGASAERWYYLCADAHRVHVIFSPETWLVQSVSDSEWHFR